MNYDYDNTYCTQLASCFGRNKTDIELSTDTLIGKLWCVDWEYCGENFVYSIQTTLYLNRHETSIDQLYKTSHLLKYRNSYRVMHVFEWRTVYTLMGVFWCLFTKLRSNKGIYTKITLLWVHKQFVMRLHNTILYFLHKQHNKSINDCKNWWRHYQLLWCHSDQAIVTWSH